jgi:hypothetical protein
MRTRCYRIVAALLLGACALPAAAAVELPPGPNRDLAYGKCRTCHDLQYLIDSKGITRPQWDSILTQMKSYGLEVSESQRKALLEYLATYLGPNPPKQAQKSGGGEQKLGGKNIFDAQCASCHQTDGSGQPGEFPPLAGNRDLNRTRLFPVYVLLNGLEGKIQVNGQHYNGQMPSFDFLSDDKIAAVVRYIRTAWGNERPGGVEPVSSSDVKKARNAKGRPSNPSEVHQYRQRHPLQ